MSSVSKVQSIYSLFHKFLQIVEWAPLGEEGEDEYFISILLLAQPGETSEVLAAADGHKQVTTVSTPDLEVKGIGALQ